MKRKHKAGSYLVEAALTMPIFILAVIMLMSSVPTLSTVENTVFSVVDEMRLESVKTAMRENQYILPVKLKGRVYLENDTLQHFQVVSYKYLYQKNDIEDLISVHCRLICEGNDPFGLFKHVSFDGNITARAYTGTLHKNAPNSGDVESKMVYIFPEWGMRYHDKTCTYIKGSCQMVYLSQETKKDYAPCDLCDAKSAQIGSPVFCFLRYGEVYHLEECRMVERYYIKLEQYKAKEQGYTPCSKCGG